MQEPDNPLQKNRTVATFGRPRSFLNNRFVYLVLSQRARGLSIGVNANPDKKCNFKCVYCEVNRAQPGLDATVDLPIMAGELQSLLKRVTEKRLRELPDFSRVPEELLQLKEVALSGDGEPTLSPQFSEVLEEVLRQRSRGPLDFFKVVVITNTAGLVLPQVRRALRLLTDRDEIWVKLDAGTQEYMNKVNVPDLTLAQVLSNILTIAKERPVVVQSLFPLLGEEGPSLGEIEQYAQRLRELKEGGAKIDLVQVYSSHRPPENAGCSHLPLKALASIARAVRNATGLRAEVF